MLFAGSAAALGYHFGGEAGAVAGVNLGYMFSIIGMGIDIVQSQFVHTHRSAIAHPHQKQSAGRLISRPAAR